MSTRRVKPPHPFFFSFFLSSVSLVRPRRRLSLAPTAYCRRPARAGCVKAGRFSEGYCCNVTDAASGHFSVSFRGEPVVRSIVYGRLGRVEDGRGSLGPKANAPFPIPAHQTKRADFRQSAFRLA